ncbi:hypothetical protein AC26_0036 [Escherichia coli 1-176-05_S3_C2]|nr:hypothetical protein AC26_0036 [Escherichia coli 1-176-05_S3_C2]
MILKKISPNKKRHVMLFLGFHSDCNGKSVSEWIKKEHLPAAYELVTCRE